MTDERGHRILTNTLRVGDKVKLVGESWGLFKDRVVRVDRVDERGTPFAADPAIGQLARTGGHRYQGGYRVVLTHKQIDRTGGVPALRTQAVPAIPAATPPKLAYTISLLVSKAEGPFPGATRELAKVDITHEDLEAALRQLKGVIGTVYDG